MILRTDTCWRCLLPRCVRRSPRRRRPPRRRRRRAPPWPACPARWPGWARRARTRRRSACTRTRTTRWSCATRFTTTARSTRNRRCIVTSPSTTEVLAGSSYLQTLVNYRRRVSTEETVGFILGSLCTALTAESSGDSKIINIRNKLRHSIPLLGLGTRVETAEQG